MHEVLSLRFLALLPVIGGAIDLAEWRARTHARYDYAITEWRYEEADCMRADFSIERMCSFCGPAQLVQNFGQPGQATKNNHCSPESIKSQTTHELDKLTRMGHYNEPF